MNEKWINKFTTVRKILNGQLGLLIVCSIVIIVWRIQHHNIQQNYISHKVSPLEDSIYSEWLSSQLVDEPMNSNNEIIANNNLDVAKELQSFDPNNASIETMVGSGVPRNIAKNIFNYRNKGGTYRKVDDLKKLYAINDSIYNILKPFVSITEVITDDNKFNNYNEKKFNNTSVNYVPKSYFQFNLNTVDKETLMKLKGIGQGYAQRIIDRRVALGGFYIADQLKEIYGFPDSTFDALAPYIQIDVNDIVGIDFNNATESELAAHPYIGKRMAKDIIKVRQDLGGFKQTSDLRNIPLLNEEKYRKIAKYFKNP